MAEKNAQKTEIWDIYIRIFHWLLTILVLTSFISIKYFDSLDVHFISGYCIVGLLVFRITWGLFGSKTAKFINFVKGPTAILEYFKSMASPENRKPSLGHSPIAAVSVVAMLLILIFQVVSGLFFYDEEIFLEGPLAQYGSELLQNNAYLYHPIGSKLIMVIIGFHLIAIATYYIFFKQNLISPMVKGWRESTENSSLNVKHVVASVCIICALAVVIYILTL